MPLYALTAHKMPLYALTAHDVLRGPAYGRDGWFTKWTEEDDDLALPGLVQIITGRPFLGAEPGIEPAYVVPEQDLGQILRASLAQTLTSEAAKARRDHWHEAIRQHS